MYYIPQITNSDCLFTAFKMLLANARGNKDYLFMQENEKHGAYSFQEIIELGKSYGVELFGFEADDKTELKKCGRTQMILTVNRNNALHSVYVYKVTEKKVYYLDSDIGKVVIPFERFSLLWDGKGLMLKKKYESEKSITKFDIPTKRSLLGKIFQTVCTISFAAAIYFIDDTYSVIIPICLILLGATMDVLTKIVDLGYMKKFDLKTGRYLREIKSKNFSEFLPRRENLKQSIFSHKNNYFYYLLCSIFVIFIVLTGSPMNVGCVFVPIILAIIQCLFIAPIESKKNKEIEQKEVKFSKEKGSNSASRTLREIQKEAYHYSSYYILKNSIGIILFAITALITLNLVNSLTFLNVAFLTFTEIFLYQNISPILTFESRRNELNLNYMKFINLFQ